MYEFKSMVSKHANAQKHKNLTEFHTQETSN